jgi:hypothetical protein
MRDAAKGATWKERGCEIVLADMKDAGHRRNHCKYAVHAAESGGQRSKRSSLLAYAILFC